MPSSTDLDHSLHRGKPGGGAEQNGSAAASHSRARSGEPKRLFCWSGGGFQGLDVHAGIWLALEEAGITADANAGTSAGAIVAAMNSQGYGPATAAAIVSGLRDRDVRRERLFWRLRIRFIDHFLVPDPLRHLLAEYLPSTFSALVKPCTVHCTCDTSAGAVQMDNGDLRRAVLASAAIAGVFPPVPGPGGVMLSDGGTTANLPLPHHWDEYEEVWLLIAKAPLEYRPARQSILYRLIRNYQLLVEDQVNDTIALARASHPHVHVVRPAVRSGGGMLRFDHGLIEQAYRWTQVCLRQGGGRRDG